MTSNCTAVAQAARLTSSAAGTLTMLLVCTRASRLKCLKKIFARICSATSRSAVQLVGQSPLRHCMRCLAHCARPSLAEWQWAELHTAAYHCKTEGCNVRPWTRLDGAACCASFWPCASAVYECYEYMYAVEPALKRYHRAEAPHRDCYAATVTALSDELQSGLTVP